VPRTIKSSPGTHRNNSADFRSTDNNLDENVDSDDSDEKEDMIINNSLLLSSELEKENNVKKYTPSRSISSQTSTYANQQRAFYKSFCDCLHRKLAVVADNVIVKLKVSNFLLLYIFSSFLLVI
jgi:hypothetical protein